MSQRDAPREFQINQLRRRFRPEEEQNDSETILKFGLVPSDPDFPFELEKLLCTLHVPKEYPAAGRPRLRVTNPEMPRGFQINVEKGFDGLIDNAVKGNRQVTLLGLMNSLDKNLERFLTAEKAQTIKIVPNTGNRHATTSAQSADKKADTNAEIDREAVPIEIPPEPRPEAPEYSPEQRADAERTRNSETKQLAARLGRMSLFQKSDDGLSYTVPIVSNPSKTPDALRSVTTARLVVPELYPLERSSIELPSQDSPEARAVERGFKKWVAENPQASLMSQVNYLAQNLHVLAKTPVPEEEAPKEQAAPNVSEDAAPDALADDQEDEEERVLDDRPHVKIIPRPPEWSAPHRESDTDGDFTSEEDSEEYSDEDEGGAAVPDTTPGTTPAKGVALDLPGLELFGIELLELKQLCVTVKCERCKDPSDIKNIKPSNDPNVVAPIKAEACKKCGNSMNIGFRRELMHPASHRAGYLDLVGCTVFDLLPSYFVPTCAECSTPFPTPGINAVRGSNAAAACRECHRRLVFTIPDVKFMVVGPSAVAAQRPATRKKIKENLGIVAGQELPRRGRCAHYAKSYRWFRFSCCAKVFPCDKCHDAAMDHPNEHANRMICGFCSREQLYRPEDCNYCKNVLVGKLNSGFWEGGKGTRDKVKMSRKDPRKYKRRPGTTPAKGSSKKS